MPAESCPQCRQFQSDVSFDYSDAEWFKTFHDSLTESAREGALQVERGDLGWSDHIACVLRCARCGALFRLECETLHGRGGCWHPERVG
jgi:hypothetical protein